MLSQRNKALLYLTSVFSYNLDFTAGAIRALAKYKIKSCRVCNVKI